MHEFWICQRIFDIVKEHADKEKCTRVKIIYLEISELAIIDKSALLFGFDVVTKNTISENALLKFIAIPGLGGCEYCHVEYKINRDDQACDVWGNFLRVIDKGEELRVKNMEVE